MPAFHLLRSNGVHAPTVVGVFDSCAAAVLAAYARLDIAHFEADADHPGCADMITTSGTIYLIEPAARRNRA